MATIAITGAASGIGSATARRMRAAGHRVLGVDLHDADIDCDLGTAHGRESAIARITELSEGTLDGFVACAGLAGLSTREGPPLVSVNYFGTVVLLERLRPALAASGNAAAVAMSSNSATVQPGWPVDVAHKCLEGDEEQARKLAGEQEHGSVATYPATKAALAWYVRSNACTPEWAGAGVRLNAVAPGLVNTAMTESVRADPLLGAAIDGFPSPRGSGGQPEEVAAVIEFLLSESASLLYGSVVFADGGTDALLRPTDWPAVWNP